MENVQEPENGTQKNIVPQSKEKIFITTKIKKLKHWSREEDTLLIEAANKFKQKSWTKVSLFFKDKNAAQCRARYKRIRPGIVKGPWTLEEDEKIIDLVSQMGKNWALISKLMPTRNGKQIRDRFLNYLDPNINKIKFTDDEDKQILDLYIKHGSRWSVIAKHFKGRTGDMIKNRFYSCLKRKIHVYEVNSSKRLRKKYYKSKKLMQITKENEENNLEFNNKRKNDNTKSKMPLIAINISHSNNYKLKELNEIEHEKTSDFPNPNLKSLENFDNTVFQKYLYLAQNVGNLPSPTNNSGTFVNSYVSSPQMKEQFLQNLLPFNQYYNSNNLYVNHEILLASLYNLNNLSNFNTNDKNNK